MTGDAGFSAATMCLRRAQASVQTQQAPGSRRDKETKSCESGVAKLVRVNL